MEKWVVLAYDLVAVLIILLTVSRSAQRGFATGIFRLVGRLAAFFGSMFLAREGASIVYDSFLKTEVTSFLNRNLQGGQAADIISQLQAGLDQLPRLLGNALNMGLNTDDIAQALSQGTESLVNVLEQSVIGPAVQGLVSVLLFTVCYAVLGGLVRLLTSAIHFVFRSPILQPIDRFLGLLVGVLQAGLNLYLICVLFRILFYIFGAMRYCNQDILMSTLIWSRIYPFDPLSLLP